jgi:hypothetical protein
MVNASFDDPRSSAQRERVGNAGADIPVREM